MLYKTINQQMNKNNKYSETEKKEKKKPKNRAWAIQKEIGFKYSI